MSLRYLVKKVAFSCGDHRGFTLVELLVALAVGSIVMVGTTQTLQQIFILVAKAESSVLAMRQVQFAGDWIVRDALAAQVIPPAGTPINLSNTPLVFYKVNWGSDGTTLTYSVDKSDPVNYKLRRREEKTYYVTGTKTDNVIWVADSITSLTAQYAQPAGMDRKALTVTIVATIGSSSENRTFMTSPRSF